MIKHQVMTYLWHSFSEDKDDKINELQVEEKTKLKMSVKVLVTALRPLTSNRGKLLLKMVQTCTMNTMIIFHEKIGWHMFEALWEIKAMTAQNSRVQLNSHLRLKSLL